MQVHAKAVPTSRSPGSQGWKGAGPHRRVRIFRGAPGHGSHRPRAADPHAAAARSTTATRIERIGPPSTALDVAVFGAYTASMDRLQVAVSETRRRRKDTNGDMAETPVIPVRLPDALLARVQTHRERLKQLTGIE